MEKLVPCLCYLCNGKLVSRYTRRKHAEVCSCTSQEQLNSDDQYLLMSREQAGDEQQSDIEDDQLSDEQEVCKLTTYMHGTIETLLKNIFTITSFAHVKYLSSI